MREFIKLTIIASEGGSGPFVCKKESIHNFYLIDGDDRTCVDFNDKRIHIFVKETPEEILAMLEDKYNLPVKQGCFYPDETRIELEDEKDGEIPYHFTKKY